LKRGVDLDVVLLGPAFDTLTPDQFISRIRSFKIEKKLKAPKLPKIKAAPVLHDVNKETKVCSRCSKKPRKTDGICKIKK